MSKMSASFAKGTTTSIKHNNRDFEEKDWENKYHLHINRERENENIYLEQTPIREKYQELFGTEVEKYNSTQKRKDRKIEDYYDKVKNDKTLNTQYEFIVQVGTKDDFLDKENKEKANEILQDYFKEFEERNPNLKIYNAVIHNDEASPHLHLNVIPVADGYKRGMKLRPAFNKAIENQGFERTGDSRQVFREWRNSELDALEKLMKERNIERELVGTNDIKSMPEYKKVMKDIENIERDLTSKNLLIETKEKTINSMKDYEYSLEGKIKARKNELENILDTGKFNVDLDKLGVKEQTKDVKVKSGETFGFGKLQYEFDKTVQKKTGNVILPKKNFDVLIRSVEDVATAKKQVKEFMKTDLVQENIELKEMVDNNAKIAYSEIDKNKELLEENKDLRAEVQSLRSEIREIYRGVKSFFREYLNAPRELRTVLNDIVNRVKENVRGGDFERTHKRENNRSHERGR